MTEIVQIKLENEMDLILAHKRTMKLAELCGMSLIVQTSFATAVSEISRCVIGKGKKSGLTLYVEKLKNNKKNLVVKLVTNDAFKKEHKDALKYATRLVHNLQVNEGNETSEVLITLPVGFSGLINDAKIESFINYFKQELPLSPYDEIRKKNIQLLELADKLKDSEQQYRSLTETLPLMMFSTNGNGTVTYGNKWLKDYFGISEFTGAGVSWTSLVHLPDTRAVREEWEKSMNAQVNLRTQARLRTKGGEEEALWHLLSVMPVKNDAGQLTGWTGFFVDIHAQKVYEETLKNNAELKAAQKQLLSYQQKLEEKVEELNKSNHDLEQFAYIASHDLQEPLRKIRTFTELLQRSQTDKEKVTKLVEKIDNSSMRMLNLIKGVLNYSRLSKAESTFEDVNLQEIVNQVKQDLELTIEEKKAVVKGEDLPVISGMRQQLYQLFYNLVSNALKFSEKTPTVTITSRPLTYEEIKTNPLLHKGVKYVRLTVKDNGIGFDQKFARQIFTIFSRLNGRDAYAGTGIGLALCKKIVDNHHGEIRAESEEGKGASFIVTLPLN